MIHGREHELVILECDGQEPRVMMRRLAEKWAAEEKRRNNVICRIRPAPLGR